jgi:hypothetical protein
MSTTKIIAFAGVKGSGKNTAAMEIQRIFGEQRSSGLVVEFAFADPLKNIIHESFDIDNGHADEIKRLNIKPFNGLTLRQVYQRLGEAIKSRFGQDIWADFAVNRMQEFVDVINPDIIICTDLRYTNEEAHLRKFADDNGHDLYIIKMLNTNIVENDQHISETQIHEIKEDFLIKASDPDEIKLQIGEIYNAISE